MREIKFRVYDKEEKCYSDKAFSIDQLGICYVQDEDGYWEEIDEERYIVEQSTGLEDKNGEEIHDGDIVRTKNIINRNAMYFAVRFEDGGFTPFIDTDPDMVELDLLKVIGNIHENPELLEEKGCED